MVVIFVMPWTVPGWPFLQKIDIHSSFIWTKETQAYSLAPRFWPKISLFPPILPIVRPQQIWGLQIHSLRRIYLGGCLESSIPVFREYIRWRIGFMKGHWKKKLAWYERRSRHKKERTEWKVEKRNPHLNTISTSGIYIPIFIDLYSIWDACIDICKYTSI